MKIVVIGGTGLIDSMRQSSTNGWRRGFISPARLLGCCFLS